ncbi:MAG TPA: PepSY domain-containing protein [Gemmataceae bacterium]|nr:PepSY domain-containing protein [Gemmataceae bacterium]
MKNRASVSMIAFITSMVFPLVAAHAYSGQQYADQAKINIDRARKVAIQAFPGKIISEELEHEQRGSGLRYSFDIKRKDVTHEVGVDAMTGDVLENAFEGPNAD